MRESMSLVRARGALFRKMEYVSRLVRAGGRPGSFRAPSGFSPGRICARIAALCAVFFGSLLCAAALLRALFGVPHVLSTAAAQPRVSALGVWRSLFVLVLQGCAGALTGAAMGAVVQRSRQCFDYGATVALVQGLFSLVCKGLPASLGDAFFSLLAFSAVTLAAVLAGRRACVRAELLPIPLCAAAPSPSIADGSIIWAVGEMLDKRAHSSRAVHNAPAPNVEACRDIAGAGFASDASRNV